ncbi:MAG: hypothetical protein ACRCXZ_05670, partial [Patescibacteria group bacterium]
MLFNTIKLAIKVFGYAKEGSFFEILSHDKVLRKSFFKYCISRFQNGDYRIVDEINSTISSDFVANFASDVSFNRDNGNISSLIYEKRWRDDMPNDLRRFVLIFHFWSHQVASDPTTPLAKQRSYAVKSHSMIDFLAFLADFDQFNDFEKGLMFFLAEHTTRSLLKGPLGLKHFSNLLINYNQSKNGADHLL